jgi:ATP-binding cassette subfamily B protein
VTPGHHDEEILGKVYDSRLLRRLWPFLSPHRGLLLLSLALIPPRALFEALPARFFAIGLDELVGSGSRHESAWLASLSEPPPGFSLLLWLAGVMLLVTVLGSLVELLRTVAMAVMGQRAMRQLRRTLFDHVQRLPLRFFDRYPVGRLVTRLTNDVETLSEMFTAGVVALVSDLFLMGYLAYLLFRIDATLALVAMSAVPVLTIAALIFRWKVREAFRLVRVKIARINTHLQETISGMKVVQLFTREERNLKDFARINKEHRNAWFRSIRYDSLLFSAVDLASNLTIALILWYGARMLELGAVGLGTLFIFVDYMQRFFRPLRDLSAKYSVMQSSMASCERIFELLDTPTDSPDLGRTVPGPLRGEVVFDRVTFAYGDEPVLEDVSLRVAPGERVALVGPTGSGKTTMLKLLTRLYDVRSGSIRVDGVDVRDYSRAELRRHLAFVLQDVFLFTGDLHYNIGLGREDISEAEIRRAGEVVHVDRLVERLPDGYRQHVHERGVNFSAGERQLLSFARALAQRPQILLLDEATSNVDTETEVLIQDALHRLLEGKTAIVVAHRLSTIQDVDRIYVLHQGRMREEGTHDELLARRGLYWRLYQLQYAAQSRTAA